MKKTMSMFAALAMSGAFAAITGLSPDGGETVPLLPEAQKSVLALPTREERSEAARAADKAGETKKSWRASAPLVFSWKADGGESGPWRIRISETPDTASGRDFWIKEHKAKCETNGTDVVWSCKVPMPNLEIARRYWWDVTSNVICPRWECGTALNGPCGCGKKTHATVSPAATFATEDLAPRWIAIEGRTKNIRDLGGWKTADGGRVRQGILFRGEGLNDNSVSGTDVGSNRLTVADVEYMTGRLGIRTDLDLRSKREVASMDASPLGAAARFVNVSSATYSAIFGEAGKKAMAENFRVVCDPSNAPVYFHCIGGADRTGALAYVLNGLLGVGKEDLERDWESTFYPKVPGIRHKTDWQGERYFDEGFAKYGKEGDSLQERIRLYLLDCGITQEEMDAFRKMMLEEPSGN